MSLNISDTQYFAVLCTNYYLHNLISKRATIEQRIRSFHLKVLFRYCKFSIIENYPKYLNNKKVCHYIKYRNICNAVDFNQFQTVFL